MLCPKPPQKTRGRGVVRFSRGWVRRSQTVHSPSRVILVAKRIFLVFVHNQHGGRPLLERVRKNVRAAESKLQAMAPIPVDSLLWPDEKALAYREVLLTQPAVASMPSESATVTA